MFSNLQENEHITLKTNKYSILTLPSVQRGVHMQSLHQGKVITSNLDNCLTCALQIKTIQENQYVEQR